MVLVIARHGDFRHFHGVVGEAEAEGPERGLVGLVEFWSNFVLLGDQCRGCRGSWWWTGWCAHRTCSAVCFGAFGSDGMTVLDFGNYFCRALWASMALDVE